MEKILLIWILSLVLLPFILLFRYFSKELMKKMITLVLLIDLFSPLLIPISAFLQPKRQNHQEALVKGQPTAFSSYVYAENRARLYMWYHEPYRGFDLYLTNLKQSSYKGEKIEECPETNFPDNKKITLKYTKFAFNIIPVGFYKVECKT